MPVYRVTFTRSLSYNPCLWYLSYCVPYPVSEYIHEQESLPNEFPALGEESDAQLVIAGDLIVGQDGKGTEN